MPALSGVAFMRFAAVGRAGPAGVT
jgi:hypothetical protein